jgi:aminoglycoside/choline kinase family phosphotransferase
VTLTRPSRRKLDKVFEAITANVLAQQQVFMHRDFHSRNLMFLDQGNPGVLDFQDAVFGPVTYDLGSLLRDAYIQWDEEIVLDWVVRYWQRAKQVGLPVNPDIDAFYRDFEFMALQRHLKILGIFCRLNYRDGKADLHGRPADRDGLRAQDRQPLHRTQTAGAPARRVRGQSAAGRLHLLIAGRP